MDRRAIIVVLDGLGIGALSDVEETRPQDLGTDSLRHALAAHPHPLPFLSRLGLALAAPAPSLAEVPDPIGSWGTSELGYPGADSFLGHQVLMGGDVSGIRMEPVAAGLDRYAMALRDAGHEVRVLSPWQVLVVDEAMLIADSLEADPGMNYNVTASLEAASFEELLAVTEVVRETAPVPRIIAVGARGLSPQEIFDAVERRDGAAAGIDTPGLGVYDRGAEIRHFGSADVGLDGQLAVIAGARGAPVCLIGKAADIVACDEAERLPAVETEVVLRLISRAVAKQPTGLIVANVQELDLAGHRQSPQDYVSVLIAADRALEALAPSLRDEDLLIVVGDHGNDPTAGPLHTREAVPVLAYAPRAAGRPLGHRSTLADVGATAADWLTLPPTAAGTPFTEEVS